MDLVTVIVPIYNVEFYLERCLDSIINQTYTYLEIILVDDGSTDSCPVICDFYEKKDTRIIVIHKLNGGLSDARNAGLQKMHGKYVVFIDSDDWVSKYYIETLYKHIKLTNADIVECEYVRTDKEIIIDEEVNYQVERFNTGQALLELIMDRKLKQVVWNKIYDCKVIRNHYFEVGKCNEDEFWTYIIFSECSKVEKISRVLYYYYQNNTSIMRKGYTLKRLDAIEAKYLRQNFIDKKYPMLSNIAATNLMDSIIYAGQMSLKYLSNDEKKKSVEILNKTIVSVFSDSKRYSFQGSMMHRFWDITARKYLVPICFIRNIFHINVGMNIETKIFPYQ